MSSVDGIHTLCRWPPNCVSHSILFSEPTHTLRQRRIKVCGQKWRKIKVTCCQCWITAVQTELEKLDFGYSTVISCYFCGARQIAAKRWEARITTRHFDLWGFHYFDGLRWLSKNTTVHYFLELGSKTLHAKWMEIWVRSPSLSAHFQISISTQHCVGRCWQEG